MHVISFGAHAILHCCCFSEFRDYLYDRDENGEYFFGIPKGNKIEAYLLPSSEDLYDYLAEESEGFSLIARKNFEKTDFFLPL